MTTINIAEIRARADAATPEMQRDALCSDHRQRPTDLSHVHQVASEEEYESDTVKLRADLARVNEARDKLEMLAEERRDRAKRAELRAEAAEKELAEYREKERQIDAARK